MTEIQEAVNEIHKSYKSDWMLTVWYRSEHGRAIKRQYQSAEILNALSKQYEGGITPIDSLYREITVGHQTPETHTGGYLE